MSPVGRQMQNRKFGFYLLCTVIAALGTIIATSVASAQIADGPWMNPKLSPEERADIVLKQLTLDEKLALLHGNGMAHAPQWQMPLSHLTNGGAGYVEGVMLPKGSEGSFKRLVGWKRITLAPGESQTVTVAIDDRVLKTFDEEKNAWNLPPGEYQVLAGSSSDNTPLTAGLVVR